MDVVCTGEGRSVIIHTHPSPWAMFTCKDFPPVRMNLFRMNPLWVSEPGTPVYTRITLNLIRTLNDFRHPVRWVCECNKVVQHFVFTLLNKFFKTYSRSCNQSVQLLLFFCDHCGQKTLDFAADSKKHLRCNSLNFFFFPENSSNRRNHSRMRLFYTRYRTDVCL